MKRIVHFVNTAMLILFVSCIVLLIGGMEYRAADVIQSIEYHKSLSPHDESEEDFDPRSDYYLPHDDLFLETNQPQIILL